MQEQFVTAGFVLIIIGIMLIMVGGISGTTRGESKWAVGGFIGPLPICFASSPGMMRLLLIVMLVMVAFFFLLPMLLRYIAG